MGHATFQELADRCDERADDLQAELELLNTELAAHQSHRDARWAAYEANISEAECRRWVMFSDRTDACRRNARATSEDIGHYRQCAAAIRALGEKSA